ncbi:T9SS type A sorting domain-containing protein [Candidatus Neomarinimicrobiota bacterium]
MRTLIATVSLIAMLVGQAAGQPIKCGWASHPPAAHDRITAVALFRPDRHQSYISPDTAFMVHYDTSGFDAPDLTSTRPDGIPDWVAEIAVALDSVRSLLLALGFDPALPDDDSIFDVYLQDNGGGLYGETIFTTPEPGGGYSAYIEMDNDFGPDENYHTHGLAAARVTCAHEYFHAVQLAQGFKASDVFLYELTSTWFEEVAFPEVNDWVWWFDEAGGFAHDPTEDMVRTDGYSIAAFGHYLTSRAPDTLNIMARIWEQFRSTTAREAISQALVFHGGNLTSAWTDFVGRLFLNGLTAKYYFHPDQDLMAEPDDGPVHQLSELHRVSFDYLTPGRVDIQALEIAANQGFSFEVDHAPSEYAARIVILGNQPYFSLLGRDSWLGTGTDQPSPIVLVAGADRDSVVVMASPGPIRFALNNLYPNPMSLSRDGTMSLEYVVPGNLSPGRHRLEVYDLLGREIYRLGIDEPMYGQLQSLSIPGYTMKTWASGVYILRLSLGSATATRRFILLK